ncbi:MAG TPA: class I SAM-dependent methyltransferase [Candidatus Bathyarchaeia archaeon]|nr:class I SAM-dependent methyltransferase [Candidatus Bathyarchaeia archaeon]
MKINLEGVEETLLIPLWGRAKFSRENPSILNDAKAIELVEQLDYDFARLDKTLGVLGNLMLPAIAKHIDDKTHAYIAEHPKASVIDLGAGLDTTYHRVDNGSIHWYDLDLPAVIDLRRRLIPETSRSTCIAKSLLDLSWLDDITNPENGVFMIAAGVLIFFHESDIKSVFSSLADSLPGAEIVFNTQSRLAKLRSNWGMQRMRMETTKWALKDARTITNWDNRIKVLDQFPLFKDIPRDPAWGRPVTRSMNLSDRNGMMNVVHLRV